MGVSNPWNFRASISRRNPYNLKTNWTTFWTGTATVNPVLSEAFARAHNTEILCGPISLASCLDLSEQGGTVTFTSPKLMKVRGRTLLVHIKALANTGTSVSAMRSVLCAGWDVVDELKQCVTWWWTLDLCLNVHWECKYRWLKGLLARYIKCIFALWKLTVLHYFASSSNLWLESLTITL